MKRRALAVAMAAVAAVAAVALHPAAAATTSTITTVAGDGIGDRGPARSAVLSAPQGIAADGRGNVYIADTAANRVRKVDPAGIITTIAGRRDPSPQQGRVNLEIQDTGDGGSATRATLRAPAGLAVGERGDLYIANYTTIRRVDLSTGVISHFAGAYNGVIDTGGGVPWQAMEGQAASGASLAAVNAVAVAPDGTVYFSDAGPHGNARIWQVSKDGKLHLYSGGGIATSFNEWNYWSTWNCPPQLADAPAVDACIAGVGGLAVDHAGDLYISDVGNNMIRRVDHRTRVISRIAGTGIQGFSGDGGSAKSARMWRPGALLVGTRGDLYFADSPNVPRLRRVDTHGVITTVAGGGSYAQWPTPDGTTAGIAHLARIQGIAMHRDGLLFSQDGTNNRSPRWSAVRSIDNRGRLVTFAGPGDRRFLGDGLSAAEARLQSPHGVAAAKSGDIYIADTANNRVRRIDAHGVITTLAGTGQRGFGGDGALARTAVLNRPYGVATDNAGRVYIADTGNNRIRRVDRSGRIRTVAGNGVPGFRGDNGPATRAALFNPNALTLDGAGNLYISDAGNQRVRRVAAATGTITTVAGTGSSTAPGPTSDPNLATDATLNTPAGLAVDDKGNLFISDFYNNRVRRVDAAAHTISTVAGGLGNDPLYPADCLGLNYSGPDGAPAPLEPLCRPTGLAWSRGALYIAVSGEDVVRRLDASGNIRTVAGYSVAGASNSTILRETCADPSLCYRNYDSNQATHYYLGGIANQPVGVAVDPQGNLLVLTTGEPPNYNDEPYAARVYRVTNPGQG